MTNREYRFLPSTIVDDHLTRFYNGQLEFTYDANHLRTKNSIKKDEIKDFQTKLYNHLKQKNRRHFRSNVALTIEIMVCQKDAPNIQSIPKCYIDLLDTVHQCSDLPWKFLALKDDSQIKILKVLYKQSPDQRNQLKFKFYPLWLVNKDLEALFRLKYGYHSGHSNYYHQEDTQSDLHESQTLQFDQVEIYNNIIESLKEKIIQDDHDARMLKYFKYLRKRSRQAALLAKHDLLLDGVIDFLISKNDNYQSNELKKLTESSGSPSTLSRLLKKLAGQNFDFNVDLKIKGNPQKKGESDLLKLELGQKIDEFVYRYPFINPLHLPVSLVVLLNRGEGKGVDLDNIMRRIILPSLNSRLTIPINESHAVEKVSDDDVRYYLQQDKYMLPSFISSEASKYISKEGIFSYEILEVKDDAVPYIKIALSYDKFEKSLVEELSMRIFKYDSN